MRGARHINNHSGIDSIEASPVEELHRLHGAYAVVIRIGTGRRLVIAIAAGELGGGFGHGLAAA